ncbi:MAG: 2-amino-4-hydroxy-6-hydroxymethyldihydropteridine diphosphokinase [Actinobacteria bacterium]|nr:2-amino-4-hydroxy-6-hydroxymethyldihydropteridine diphosphokinase [Actinomycetota bacterium]
MKAIVALGSNLGDRFEYLQTAVDELNQISQTKIQKISNVYETVPVGEPEQGKYLNAVLSLETELTAQELLLKMLLIELNLGRQREVIWGPRTIDLDLIWFNDETIDSEKLIIPHPRAIERCFVLKPWSDIDLDATLKNKKIVDLLKTLNCDDLLIFPSNLVIN